MVNAPVRYHADIEDVRPDEQETFRPAHSLTVHRPLGGVMRARMQVYRALSDFRHRENGIAAVDTAGIADIPA